MDGSRREGRGRKLYISIITAYQHFPPPPLSMVWIGMPVVGCLCLCFCVVLVSVGLGLSLGLGLGLGLGRSGSGSGSASV